MCPAIGTKWRLWRGCWRHRNIPSESIYFISEDIFTLASYYQSDLRDEGLFPAGWQMLPPDELDEPMLSTMKKPALLEQAEQMTLDDSEGLG